MSEYQYFEFQAVDRPLTQEQVSELRNYSSRAQITLTSFVNVYNWGNFKGNPNKWMEKYFDAFLYLTNWGTRWLMLRIPKRLLEHDVTVAYCTGESMSFRSTNEHHILSFCSEQEDHEWAEGEGWLASLVPLRAELMQGDRRCLYLAWLLGVQRGELDYESLEPPIPTGLGELSATLQSFIGFLCIDPDLVAAAAEKSAAKDSFELSKEEIVKWVDSLSGNDKDNVLMRLLDSDESHIGVELRQRALRETGGANRVDKAPVHGEDLRSAGQLVTRAKEIAEERREREAKRRAQEKLRREREQARNRIKHIKSLIGNEDGLWRKVDQLISTRQPKHYDEAISILRDLHDLANMQKKHSEFSIRMVDLFGQHTKKVSLIDRFRKAGLVD